ncbi:hypothetical protein [Neptunomonas sp.]|uniref:hypothetical protein n=1 Tax=Neptunomonas sp. TaxID=1971898 RepID=UPI0035673CD1
MATTEAEAAIISELKNIRTSLERGGDGGVTSQGFKEFNSSIQDSTKQIHNARKEQEELARDTNHFRKALKRFGNQHTKTLLGQIKSGEDVVRMQRRLSEDSLKQFEEIRKARESETISVTEADDKLEQLGFTSNDLKKSLTELREENVALERATEEFRHRMEGGTLASINKFAAKVTAAAGAVAAMTRPFIHVAKSAAQTGTQLETVNAALMGMAPEELNQLQADHRRIIQASGMSLDQFNETVRTGSMGLITYTGSLRDAIRINAESMNMAKVLGANQQEFMADQQRRFKELNRSVSMTAEQFMEMNKQLMDSSTVQSQLYRINVKQRSAYIQDLQNTYEKLTLDGLTHEQATKMLEVFAEIGAKSPRERLKEAAKLQAVMGAMGMGGAGAEAAGLLRGGMRGEGEAERFAEIMRQTNIAAGEMMGQGFAQEMMMTQMIETAGVGQYLGPGSEFAAFNIRQGAQIDKAYLEAQEQTKLGGKRNEILEKILTSNDMIASAVTGPIGQTLGAILTTLGALQLAGAGGLGGLLGGGGKGAGLRRMITGGGKGAGFLKGGLMRGLGAAGAAYYGIEQATQAVTTGRSDVHDALVSTETGQSISEGIGKFFTWVESGWSEDAKRRLEVMNKAEEQREKQLEIQQKQLKATEDASSEIKNQTEQQKKLAEEQSKSSGKGYRVMWTRAPRMTSQ